MKCKKITFWVVNVKNVKIYRTYTIDMFSGRSI